jgi:hypothetical protein
MAEQDQFKPKRAKTGGRKKGTKNKTSTALKEAIMNAFEEVGGKKYLVMVAHEDPKTFCTLLGKVLPAELNAKVEGDVSFTIMSGIDDSPGLLVKQNKNDGAATHH